MAQIDAALAGYRQFGLRTAAGIWLSAKGRALAAAGRAEEARVAIDEARHEIVEHGEHYTENLLLEAEAFLARAVGDDHARVAERLQAAWDLALEQGSFGSLRRLEAAAIELGVELDRREEGAARVAE